MVRRLFSLRSTTFGILAVVSIVIGLVLFPSREPVQAPSNFSVSIGSSAAISDVNVIVEHTNEAKLDSTIEIKILKAEGAGQGDTSPVEIGVTVTGRAQATSCHPTPCRIADLTATASVPWVKEAEVGQVASLTVEVSGGQLSWSANGAQFQGFLPEVYTTAKVVDPDETVSETHPIASQTVFLLPTAAAYDWDAADPPTLFSDNTGVVWKTDINDPTKPVRLDVSSPGVLRSDNNLVFVAGALIGAAGAALITMIDSIILEFRRRPD